MKPNYQALVLRSLQVGMGDAWFTCYDVFSDLAQDGHLPLELADVGKALVELVQAGQVERKRDVMDRTWIYAAVDRRSDYERNAAAVMSARGRNGT